MMTIEEQWKEYKKLVSKESYDRQWALYVERRNTECNCGITTRTTQATDHGSGV